MKSRVLFFYAALVLYALAGSPTPDSPGLIEVLIGLGLILATGKAGLEHAARIKLLSGERLWVVIGRFALCYGLCVPLVGGIARGNDLGLILRDMVPFLFWFLPLAVGPALMAEGRISADRLTFAVIFCGLAFSLRALGWSFLPSGNSELFYFANAPGVLFTALYLSGLAWQNLSGPSGLSLQAFAKAGICIGLAALPVAAMALAGQRASFAMLALYIGLMATLSLWHRPYRAIPAFAGLVVLLAFLYEPAWPLLEMLARKTATVGLNMRWQEAQAVWQALSGDIPAVLFGLGWGGSFASPAIGASPVNFTHGFLTSALLKTGLAGLVLLGGYITALCADLIRLIRQSPALGFALAAPLSIDIFLYASFKSLDFGLILLLIAVSMHYLRKVS